MSYLSRNGESIRVIINEKMRCLADFNICSYSDADMRNKLKEVIEANPDKDPREAIDYYYCRPLIYNKVWGWV